MADLIGMLSVLFYIVLIAVLVWKYGIKGLIEKVQVINEGLETVLRRIIYGPDKKSACSLTHKIAEMEITLYGEIISDSVRDHIKGCEYSTFTEGWGASYHAVRKDKM